MEKSPRLQPLHVTDEAGRVWLLGHASSQRSRKRRAAMLPTPVLVLDPDQIEVPNADREDVAAEWVRLKGRAKRCLRTLLQVFLPWGRK